MLPLFPLKLVVFPSEHLNLHIFEGRYKQLVNDCFSQNLKFGIPSYLDDKAIQYGTEMEIIKIEKTYEDGRMDIKTRGLRIIEVVDFHGKVEGKMYPGGMVNYYEPVFDANIKIKESVLQFTVKLYRLMKIKKKLPDYAAILKSFQIAHHIGLSLEQEYKLLTLRSEEERLTLIENHLIELMPVVSKMEELRKKIQMNGHFKNVIPPDIK